jgi:hypothetical protein
MKIDFESMHQHWMETSSIRESLIHPEWDSCEGMMLIRRTMVDVAKSKEDLFRSPDRMRKGRSGLIASKLGRSLEACLAVDIWQICGSFPEHRLDPYFNLFAEVYLASPLWHREYLRRDVDQLNAFVTKLRAGAKRKGFMDIVANHERGAIKNAKTVMKYIAAMYEDWPKILHVRVEFSYDMTLPRPSAEQVKADRAKLMRYVRKKFGETAIGHMWTIEFGPMKGLHFHVFFHFNGQVVRQGITIAQELGEHWQHVITNGRGIYWNVNAREEKLEAEGRRGIGLISHSDEKRRKNLIRSALYLVKADLFVRLVMPGIGKTFGHGRFRPRKKSNAGRKRKGQRLNAAVDAIRVRRGGIRRQ